MTYREKLQKILDFSGVMAVAHKHEAERYLEKIDFEGLDAAEKMSIDTILRIWDIEIPKAWNPRVINGGKYNMEEKSNQRKIVGI